MTTEYIFPNTDSSFTLQYTSSELFPTPTKIEFILNGTSVNSVDNPEYFNSTLESDGKIEFNI